MAGPIVGQVDCYIGNSFSTGSAQFMFVNCYRFLNDNTGTLGIQRLAYNTGSQDTGMTQFRGMNYFDEPNPAGQNAWAVFRFMSASVPFDVLIQWSGNSAIGGAPGAPALADGIGHSNLLAIAVAQSADLASSWNGTTKNDGSDVKGTIVWTSSSISSTVYHPRSNDAIRGGTHGSFRQNMARLSVGASNIVRAHFLADYDNLAVAFDVGADNSYSLFFFGRYVPISGANVQVPYFSFYESTIVAGAGTQYGPPAGSTAPGGVGYPNPAVSGSVSTAFERFGSVYMQNVNAQPNRGFPTPRYDEFPIHLGLFETGIVGLLGQHYELLREAYNVNTHDTNADGTRFAIGPNTLTSLKYTLPFHSGTTPGAGVTRPGTRFSIP